MRRPIILATYLIFLLITTLNAQKVIEGRVFDAGNNKPLAGVLIFAKNTVKTTKSDASGNYRLIIPEKANVLVFSYTGYAKQEVDIKGISTVEVGMRNFFSQETENIVAIGSRDITRKKNDSYSSIEIIPIADIINQTGNIELSQILHFFVASFNANRQSGADLSDHVDPLSLRGLGPDQVLILINGKRFSSSATINVFGTKGRGNVNNELNAIPASAVERIEILKDGAAAQYGSDAIAGVINIVLKTQIAGTTASISSGTHYTGWGKSLIYEGQRVLPKIQDGNTLNASITHGLKIGDCITTVTGDYYFRDNTLRPNNNQLFPDLNYREEFGDAKVASKNLYFNSRYPLKNAEIYAFGGIHNRKTDAAIWTIPIDDSTRNVYEIFPNGYNPHLKTTINNYYLVMGTKSKFKSWDFDLSYTLSKNLVKMATSQTLNPSLRQSSPTAFENGQYQFGQFSLNCDISRKYPKVKKGLNVAFGAEHRFQNYRIIAGEDASWKNYLFRPLIIKNPDGTVDTIRKIGTSQGFPGVSSHDALDVYRSQYGFYSDAELSVSSKLMVAGALRYEIYNDFNTALGTRLALRFKPTPQYSLRFSLQTGFRAPSLAQVHFRSTINDVDSKGENFEKIIFNNTSSLATKIGVPKLGVEKSINLGSGLNYTPNANFTLSTDFYLTQVNNRIILSGAFGQEDKFIGEDLKKQNVKKAQFYINALSTINYGMDLTAAYKTKIYNGQFELTLSGNMNQFPQPKIKLEDGFKSEESNLITQREAQFIMFAAPKAKLHSILNYRKNNSNINLHFSYFGKTTFISLEESAGIMTLYNPLVQTDLSYGLTVGKKTTITLGVKNLLDVYPNVQLPNITDSGGQWEGVQNGFNGAYFFSRFAFKF